MKAAVLEEVGAVPRVGEFDDPEPERGQLAVEVLAAGLNPIDIATSAGRSYRPPPPVPSVVGREAIVRLPDGRRAYSDGSVPPFGTIAERTLIDETNPIPIPDELDEAVAVGFGIAGLAGWLALEWRARLQPGERVLVLGASGTVGTIAVQAGKLLGAAWIVAAARNEQALEHAHALGADATVHLDGRPPAELTEAFREAAGADLDVVIDPIWGDPAVAALGALGSYGRHVQLGQSAAAEATVSSAAVRGKPLAILGYTNFAVPPDVKRLAYSRMADLGAAGKLTLDVERVPLDELPSAWERQQRSPGQKLVIVP